MQATIEVPAVRKLNLLNTAFIVGIPFVALAAAIWHGMTYGIGWTEALIFFIWYWCCGISITVGYHRLFSHRSHEASWPLVLFYSLFGAGAFQNSIIEWCSDHRAHHKETDKVEDPYNAKRGFLWSHIGWILIEEGGDDDFSNVKDLMANPIIAWQHRHIFLIGFLVGMVIPGMIGYLIGGVGAGIGGFIWGGLIRTVFVHHGTFLINSAAHVWGSQPYSTSNTSRDSFFLAFFTFGEGYHNFHHTFQADYRNGHKWYHFDPSKWWISSFNLLRLKRNLKRTPRTPIEMAKIDMSIAREMESAKEKNTDLSLFESRAESCRLALRNSLRNLAAKKQEYKEAMKERKAVLSNQIKEAKAAVARARDDLSNLFSEMRFSTISVSA